MLNEACEMSSTNIKSFDFAVNYCFFIDIT